MLIGLTTPGSVASGVEWNTYAEKIDLNTPGASFALETKVPVGGCVTQITLELPNAVSGQTAVKVGLGRLTATADPDKYALSAGLTASVVNRLFDGFGAIVSAEESLAIFACDTNGAAAGTIGGAGQFVLVQVTTVSPVNAILFDR